MEEHAQEAAFSRKTDILKANQSPMTTHHLRISIPDILHGKTVEWERLEFKQGWNPEAVLHTICAFANDFHNLGGGYIVVGVAEANGRPVLPPVGLDADTIDAIQKELLNLGHAAIQPQYHPRTVPYEIDGKTILIIWVPGGETRPYKAKLSLSEKKRPTGATTFASNRAPIPIAPRPSALGISPMPRLRKHWSMPCITAPTRFESPWRCGSHVRN